MSTSDGAPAMSAPPRAHSTGSGSPARTPTLEEVHRTKSRRVRRHESSSSSSSHAATSSDMSDETPRVLKLSELRSGAAMEAAAPAQPSASDAAVPALEPESTPESAPAPAPAFVSISAPTATVAPSVIGYQKNATIARLLARSQQHSGTEHRASTFRVHFASGKVVSVTFAPRTRLSFVLEAVGVGEHADLDTHDAYFLDGRHIEDVNATIDTLGTQDVRFVEREEGVDNWRCAVCYKVLPRSRFVWKTGHACFCDKCYVHVLERRLEGEFGLDGAENELSVVSNVEDAVDGLVEPDMVGIKDEGEDDRSSETEDGTLEKPVENTGETACTKDGATDDATAAKRNGAAKSNGASKKNSKLTTKSNQAKKNKSEEKRSDALDAAIAKAVATVATPRPPRHSLSEFPDGFVERILAAHHFDRALVEANVDDEKEEHYEVEDDKDASDASTSAKEAPLAERRSSKAIPDKKVKAADSTRKRSTTKDRRDVPSTRSGPRRDERKVSVRYVPPDVLEAGRKFITDVKDVKKLYRIEQESGQGGFGSVFLAKDHKRRTRVAVKRLTHVTEKNQETNYGEIGFLALSKHANIVAILDAHIRHGTAKKPAEAWIVLEFLHGGTLKRAAQAHKFSADHIAFVGREILCGLSYLHSRGWVHRDIKSANIMLDARGLIKLIDFGLATEVEYAGPRMGMAGSRYWLAPEIILRQPHARPVDVWAAGVCLLEMFSGRPPYYPHTLRCMFHSATRGLMDKVPNEVAPECRDFFSKIFVIDPARRATVDTLLQHAWLKREDLGRGIQDVFKAVFFSNALSDMMGYL